MSDIPNPNLSPKILSNIKKFKKRQSILCLECGYNGLMGVKEEKIKFGRCFLFATIATLIAADFCSLYTLPMVFGAVFGIGTALFLKITLLCPNCEKELVSE